MKSKYKSFLFVPATEKLLKKIEYCNADAIIVDLEDAILPNDKDAALERLSKVLKNYSYKTDLFVRINSERLEEEICILKKFDIAGYMLPKTEQISDIEQVLRLDNSKKIIALIETAMGILNAEDLISQKGVSIIAFGAEDYTSQCGIKNAAEFLMYPKSKLVLCAKAYGKPVIDTISLNIRDMESYREEVQSSKDFGFDGKMAIHPNQADVINKVFRDDTEYYKYIVSQYEKCGVGVMELDGKIYEKPHIDAIRQKIGNID